MNPRYCIVGGTLFTAVLMIGLVVAILFAVDTTRRPACTSTLKTEPPGSYFILDGLSTFKILCYDGSQQIKWIHHGDTIGPYGYSRNPYTVSFRNFSSKLIFKDGTKDMSGIYTCDSGRTKKSIQIEFRDNTIYFEEPESVHLEFTEGSRIQLHCSAHSEKSVNYRWFHLNEEIKESQNLSVRNFECGSFLNINYAKSYHGNGIFRCKASNIYGIVTKEFYLTVLKEKKLPFFYKNVEHVKAVKGSNVQLHCAAQSDEQLDYVWWGKRLWYHYLIENTTDLYILHTNQASSLFIGNIEAKDVVYECRAESISGWAKKQFYVTVVTDVPPYFDGKIEYRKVIEGHSVEFFCRAQSEEAVSYNWLDKDFNPIEETNNTYIGNTYDASSLYILKAGENVSAYYNVYESDYHCNATNIYGTSTKTFRLSVNMVLPRFPQSEEFIDFLYEGDFFRLPCAVWSNDKVSLTWFDEEFKQITETEELQRYIAKDGSYLYFYNLRPIDGGDYYCNATNIYGSRRKVFHVSVIADKKPFFGENRIHVTAVRGSSVQFYCSARSHEIVEYGWSRMISRREYINITNTDNEYAVYTSNASILILNDVQVMKDIEYYCDAENSYGSNFKRFTLSVESGEDPTDETDHKNVTVLKGSKLELLCWHPHTKEATYQWVYQDGKTLSENTTFPAYVSPTEKGLLLTINRMEESLSGVYSCNVSNSDGYNISEYNIQINTVLGIDPDIRKNR